MGDAEKPPATSGGTQKNFHGPWASAFSDAYRIASDSEVREALADGEITDAEYNYFVNRISNCMTDLGLTNVKLKDGEWAYTRPVKTDETAVDKCLQDGGARVLLIRDAIARNPEHLDEDEIMARCLVGQGLVPKSYTAKQYSRETESENFSFDFNSAAFEKCNDDPLGLSNE
ncbi:hypothetical protein [Curtobacterium sp. VKM Ac-2852]|uniref:hypothetical protein n=1 Tax=Curtobacterium sp. VKM Ac-2852 TaxID=2739024 RepID=UPI001563257B|nr:hypothetical protein [Curtobacterium sp. VKM Ac-2852]NQX24862.1 hypothetical protein [Curtobacterium sp. VKM Ac-2852]